MKQPAFLKLGLACCGLIQHGLAQNTPEATPPSPVATERITVYDTRLNSLEAPTETGSRLGVPLSDIPASVFNIDQLTIRTRGFRTAQEAVESVVGFTGANSQATVPPSPHAASRATTSRNSGMAFVCSIRP